MTELLYLTDSYLREFTATVDDITEDGVVLDRTAFYPEGGGQPSDIGALLDDGGRQYVVRKVQRVKGQVVHKIDGESPAAGAEVRGAVDWDRRHKLMRTHTALHILCGVIWRDYGALVTGGNMEPLKARMDFELESMSAAFSDEVEAKINAEVAAARPVHIDILPRQEAFQIPDLIRTKINLLPEGIKEVRVVEIEGLDLQADGGTHVANTKEVGRIRVTGHESKGRINKRLRIEIEE
ncbi:MAG TPA: alanyl-tRNA editing protein [Anaerolineae bacterium]|nr:alanyl-tRNA editing protein [Anaerolineae bacterium]